MMAFVNSFNRFMRERIAPWSDKHQLVVVVVPILMTLCAAFTVHAGYATGAACLFICGLAIFFVCAMADDLRRQHSKKTQKAGT